MMNSARAAALAERLMPKVATRVAGTRYREGVAADLTGSFNIGIELGVAGGSFSKMMVDSGKFSRFYGVDAYSDFHAAEYLQALRTVGIDRNFTLLRMAFDEALTLFPDEFFDFIYIDGFAHTGEEGGRLIAEWLPKLKVSGILAGDDYAPNWPLVRWAVNDAVDQLGVPLSITGKTRAELYSEYPSWWLTKPRGGVYRPSIELERIARAETSRIYKIRSGGGYWAARRVVRGWLSGLGI